MTFKNNGRLIYDEMSPYVRRLKGTQPAPALAAGYGGG